MVGAHGGVEAVVAVGEMAEAVAGALEWRHERRVAKDVSREWDWAEVESDLDIQRRENQRLRATIHMYEEAFQELHRQKLDSGQVSVDRSMAVYEQLKQRVASPAFLDKLKPFQDGASTSSDATVLKMEDGVYVKADVDDPNWWLWLSENDSVSRDIKEVQDGLGCDGYVIVNQEDIVDSIASYIARYISSIPQAKSLTPKELQIAMTQAFTKVEKKGRLRSLYTTGKFLYTAGSWGATALSIYKHPMVIRAASMAVWTSCCLILKLWTWIPSSARPVSFVSPLTSHHLGSSSMADTRRKVLREKQVVKDNQNVKQKRGGSGKAKGKKDDAHNPLEQHEKEGAKKKKKRSSKTVLRPKKVVHHPLDRIRQMEPLKGALQQHVSHFTGRLIERNVGSQQHNMQPSRSSAQTAPSQISSQVPEREPAQIAPKKDCFPASEKAKKADSSSDNAAGPRRPPSASTSPRKGRTNGVPFHLALCNIKVPVFPFEGAAASHRTVSRAHALVEHMALHSRLNTPSQGLSALAPDLPPRKPKLVEAEVEANCLKEDVTCGVVQEGRKSVEGRSIKSRQVVPLFEDYRPGSGSQKFLKPRSVDRSQWQRQEMERQQDRRFIQKKALRKKELRYLRRLEGVGPDVEDRASNSTLSTTQRDAQSVANSSIREDVEESGGAYAAKLVQRGSRNGGSDSGSVSMSSFGPNRASFSDQTVLWTRPTTCETKQTNSEIVVALSSANARREGMRKELALRLREELVRKKVFLAQERAAAKMHHMQCTRC